MEKSSLKTFIKINSRFTGVIFTNLSRFKGCPLAIFIPRAEQTRYISVQSWAACCDWLLSSRSVIHKIKFCKNLRKKSLANNYFTKSFYYYICRNFLCKFVTIFHRNINFLAQRNILSLTIRFSIGHSFENAFISWSYIMKIFILADLTKIAKSSASAKFNSEFFWENRAIRKNFFRK